MDRVRLGILLYTVIGLALAAAGAAAGYMVATGELPLQGPQGYLAAAAALAGLVVGLHWAIVGAASLRD